MFQIGVIAVSHVRQMVVRRVNNSVTFVVWVQMVRSTPTSIVKLAVMPVTSRQLHKSATLKYVSLTIGRLARMVTARIHVAAVIRPVQSTVAVCLVTSLSMMTSVPQSVQSRSHRYHVTRTYASLTRGRMSPNLVTAHTHAVAVNKLVSFNVGRVRMKCQLIPTVSKPRSQSPRASVMFNHVPLTIGLPSHTPSVRRSVTAVHKLARLFVCHPRIRRLLTPSVPTTRNQSAKPLVTLSLVVTSVGMLATGRSVQSDVAVVLTLVKSVVWLRMEHSLITRSVRSSSQCHKPKTPVTHSHVIALQPRCASA